MSDNQYGGWLGLDEERRAWGEARHQADVVSMSRGPEPQLYQEFSEVADTLPALQAKYKGRPFTWDLERRLYKRGKLPYNTIPHHFQLTSDCVAAGLAGAIKKLHVLELALDGQEEVYHEPFIPWLYAVSRNQIGKGRIRGAGSTGAWGARAINEYGTLFADDPDAPKYKDVCDSWGNRRNRGNIEGAEYAKFAPVANDNKVAVVRATDVDQMIALLDAGYMLTIASSWGFKASVHKGHMVYRKTRKDWGHQMHITDFMRDPFPAFRRENQWGEGHVKALGENSPAGGAWNTAEDVEKEFRSGIEVYGYRNFSGSPGEPDFNIV